MGETEQLQAHAERIRASGVLGRSRFTRRLFDYLVECSIGGRAPKEIEVAVDVFDKDASFDVSQDALVRVYVHKLRRKLDDYYAGAGSGEAARLVVPKGVYRFALQDVPAPVERTATPSQAKGSRRWLAAALAVSVLVNAIGAAMLFARDDTAASPADSYRAVRANPVWSQLLGDDRTIFVVVGDYYIFGELDPGTMEVGRLVREFSINSRKDLERELKRRPELEERYMDLELAYLPTASAYALREVMPVLAAAGRRVRMVTVSELNPAILKSAHVVYIGYISGLGMLQDVVFASSNFAVGDTYDELVHRATDRRYISQVASPLRGDARYQDYGFFSTFSGPTDNRILVIAGTRDIAVMHVAESLTRGASVDDLVRQAGDASAFEALYEVYGMDRTNIDGKLLLTSTLEPPALERPAIEIPASPTDRAAASTAAAHASR